MSNSVDQRIVQMQFDNAQFERGVASTLQSLKELESGLQLKSGSSGIEEVRNIADRISFQSATGEVSKFGKVLDTLKDTANGVFANLTNGIGTLAKGYAITKGIFNTGILGLAASGGWNRASNLNRAAFKLDTMQIGWARVADQVSASVDGTAYSLDAAATAASAFAAAGVKIADQGLFDKDNNPDEMYSALKAVANVASITGSSFENISDIFGKVAAQGKVTGQQMASLQLQGFQAAEILREYFHISMDELLEMQRKGLITFDDLVSAVNQKYGDAAAAANNSYEGAFANMRSALNRVLAPFFQFYQDGMIDVFNGIRESINMVNAAAAPLLGSNGVLPQGIKGVLKEVGKAFHIWGGKRTTDKELNGGYISMAFLRFNRMFEGMAKPLGDAIEEIRKGTADFVYAIIEIFAIGREFIRLGGEILAPIADAFHAVFGDNTFSKWAREFHLWVDGILEQMSNLHVSEGVILGLKGAFTVLFGFIKSVGSTVMPILGSAIKFIFDSFENVGLMLGGVIDFIAGVSKEAQDAGNKMLSPFDRFFKLVKNIPIVGPLIKILSKLPKGFQILSDVLGGKEGATERLAKFMGGINKNFEKSARQLGNGLKFISDHVRDFAKNFKDTAFEKGQWLFDKLKAAADFMSPVAKTIGDTLGGIRDNVKKAFDSADFSIKPFKEFFDKIKDAVSDFFDEENGKFDFGKMFGAIKDAIGELADEIAPSIESFTKSISDSIYNNLSPGLQDIVDLMDEISSPFKFFEDLLSSFSSTTSSFKWPWSKDENGETADPVAALSKMFDPNQAGEVKDVVESASALEEPVAAAGDVLGNIMTIISALAHPVESIKSIASKSFAGIGEALTTFIKSIPMDVIQEFVGKMAAIGVDVGIVGIMYNASMAFSSIADFFTSMTKIGKSISKNLETLNGTIEAVKTQIRANAFVSVIIGIVLLAGALAALSFIPKENLAGALPILEELMVAVALLAGFFVLLTSTKLGTKLGAVQFAEMEFLSRSIFTLSAAIGVLAASLYGIGQLNYFQLKRSLSALLEIFIMLDVTMIIMSKTPGARAKGVGAAMLAMSASIFLIYEVIKRFADMEDSVFDKGFERVVHIASIYIALAALMSLFAGGKMKGNGKSSSVAAAMIAMTVSIIALGEYMNRLALIDPKDAARAAIIIVGIGAFLVIASYFMNKVSKDVTGIQVASITASVLSLAIGVGIIAAAVAGLAFVAKNYGIAEIWSAAGILIAVIAVLGLMVEFMTTGASAFTAVGAAGIATTLLSIGIALGVFVAGVLLLSTIPYQQLSAGLDNMSWMLLTFASAVVVIGGAGYLFGEGLVILAWAFEKFSFGVLLLGAALAVASVGMMVGVGALVMFAVNEPLITNAVVNFTNALVELGTPTGVIPTLIGMGAAMIVVGIGAAALGVGLLLCVPSFLALTSVSKETAESMLEFFKTVNDNRDEFVEGFSNMFLIAIDAIGAVFAGIGERINNWFKDSIDNTDWSGLGEAAGKIVTGLFDAMGGFIMEVGPKFLDFFKKNILDPLGGAAREGFEGVFNSVSAVPLAGGQTGELYDPMTGMAVDDYGQGYKKAEDFAKGYTEGLSDKTGEMKAANEEMAQQANEATANKMAEGAAEAVESTKQTAQEQTEALQQELGGMVDWAAILGITPEKYEEYNEQVKDMTGGLGLDALGAFSSTVEGYEFDIDFQSLIKDGVLDQDAINELMENGAFDAIGSYETGVKKASAEIDVSGFVAGKDQINLPHIKTQFGLAGTTAGNAFTSTLTKTSKQATLKPAVDKAVKTLRDPGSFKKAGTEDGKAAVSGIEEGGRGAKTAGENIGTSAANGISSKYNDAYSGGYSVGEGVGQGLVDGMRDMEDDVATEAAYLASIPPAKAKGVLQQNSPSKVFIKIAQGIGEGYIVGMASMRGEVGAASSDLAKSAITNISTQMSYMSGLLDDIDDNPVIRPVLDLTDYEAGIGRMNALTTAGPFVRAQWSNRLVGNSQNVGALQGNGQINITLNYGAGTDAAQMVNDMANMLRTRNLMEA